MANPDHCAASYRIEEVPMKWKSGILMAGLLWTAALGAQTPTPQFSAVPEFSTDPELERVLRELLKPPTPDTASVCAIPLIKAPVPKDLEPMPVKRPPAVMDRMAVAMPAPPCPEARR
jgi:hypothetical protein